MAGRDQNILYTRRLWRVSEMILGW